MAHDAWGYSNGCRCSACTEGWRAYKAERGPDGRTRASRHHYRSFVRKNWSRLKSRTTKYWKKNTRTGRKRGEFIACPSAAAYQRHRKAGEDCAACRAAFAAYMRKNRRRPSVVRASRNGRRVRRARLKSVRIDRYSREAVWERDSGLCHLCNLPTPPPNGYDQPAPKMQPESFTVDHVIPISKGGADAFDNVRTAHFICNTRKSAKLAV